MNYIHEKFMKVALSLAKEAVLNGDEPFGALLVKDDEIVMSTKNRIFTLSDPTQHAELALISDFCREKKIMDLSEYTMYTSCEPCLMCSGAVIWSQLKELVISARSSDLNRILNEEPFSSSDVAFNYGPHKPSVVKDVLRNEGIEILERYFKQ